MRLLWSQKTTAPLRGLSLARERGWLLAWDNQSCLYLFNPNGEPQAQLQLNNPLSGACCADDGNSFAVVTQTGEVRLLAPDLMPRWEVSLKQKAVAVALAPFGQYLAVSDAGGGLTLLDRTGKQLWHVEAPRPLQRLVFVPEQPLLVGSADFGLVTCFDEKGQSLWRDGLVANSGSLACNGDGSLIAVACFSDGLWCYDRTGKKWQMPQLAPCRLADVSYAGDVILAVGLENKVRLQSRDGAVRDSMVVDSAPVALALAPLADQAWVGLAEEVILCMALGPAGVAQG